MNDRKLKELFELSRGEQPPTPPMGFDARVVTALRRESRSQAGPLSLWEQLGQLLPRLAVATVMVVGVCVAVDFYASTDAPSLTAGIDQISDQWLFAQNGN
ncbi:MAG: hypothetical protein JWR19_242 [Pedosphaera sp.]|nr:hypothetical protein [Pedosphaera sp.]